MFQQQGSLKGIEDKKKKRSCDAACTSHCRKRDQKGCGCFCSPTFFFLAKMLGGCRESKGRLFWTFPEKKHSKIRRCSRSSSNFTSPESPFVHGKYRSGLWSTFTTTLTDAALLVFLTDFESWGPTLMRVSFFNGSRPIFQCVWTVQKSPLFLYSSLM